MNVHLSLFRPPQELRELNLLQELEKNPVCSQRELSNRFGFALGVTNACLKRMIQRGWIRVKDIEHRRIGYYLTPKGVAEKTKLNHHMISWSLQHYSILRDIIGQRFQLCGGLSNGHCPFIIVHLFQANKGKLSHCQPLTLYPSPLFQGEGRRSFKRS